MSRARRVLVVHPYLTSVGGGNLVAAWMLEALRSEFDTGLATLAEVDWREVNRNFGTSLGAGDVRVWTAPARYRHLAAAMRTSSALLDCQLTTRFARKVDRVHRFDVLVSTHNEVDFGRRGIQYVNLPDAYASGNERPGVLRRIPGLHAAFRACCRAVGGETRAGCLRNLFVADSQYIAGRIRESYGVDAKVVYPPVPGSFPPIPWTERRAGFVAVGRITRSKRWEMAVAIVDEVRRRGYDVTLTLLGHREDAAYQKHLETMTASRPWFRIRYNCSREELLREVASHRYGLHTMHGEHFGIAVAEILTAGCLPLVHRSGGPVEIVGAEPLLTFEDVESAADNIVAVLADPELEQRLLARAAAQRHRFTATAFCEAMSDLVRTFE
jgi:glycosyltransferase involved in cell wall biosynthesis